MELQKKKNTNDIFDMLIHAGANVNDIECNKINKFTDLKYIVSNGYSIYHPYFETLKTDIYRRFVEPLKKEITRRNTLIMFDLSKKRDEIRFQPGSITEKLTFLSSKWANMSEDKMIKKIKKDKIWDFLSIRDTEDMHQKISEFQNYSTLNNTNMKIELFKFVKANE